MLLRSSPDLHYPITVTDLLKRPNDEVQKSVPILAYTYTSKVTEGNKYGDEAVVTKTFPARIEAPTNGSINAWKVKKGDIIQQAGVALVEIDEPCQHEVQFGGLCANCGKDMTDIDYNTSIRDSERAPIMKVHGHTALTISQQEARRLEQDDKRRLLTSRKLNMVVDLDQTIIHATVDPTVAEWQRDPNNPNYDAVKDVQAFQLIDDGPGGNGCWYYIKMRPGLQKFLEEMSKLYELHIYTMGTRAYAHNVAKIVDPDRKIFGDRVLTRDENGSLDRKSLARIFPVSTKMVVIIDDRADVWGWSEHLLKVVPYDFFVGVGDINSSFLPKTQALPKAEEMPPTAGSSVKDATENTEQTTAVAEKDLSLAASELAVSDAEVVPDGDTEMSDIEQQLITIGSRDDPNLLQEQTSSQDDVIVKQIAERPLLQKQLELEKADEEQDKIERERAAHGDADVPIQHEHRHLLHDDDTELLSLERHLREIHDAFFEEYEKNSAGVVGGRVAELKGGKDSRKITADDDSLIPDVKDLVTEKKREVLKGTRIVFSGIVPQNIDIQHSDVGLWTKSFGAVVSYDINKRTTHLVATPHRKTVKVKKAARHSHIKIVTTGWLMEAFSTWIRPDETPYLIPVDDEANYRGPGGDSSPLEELDDGDFLSAEDDGAAEEPTPADSEYENLDFTNNEWEAMHDDLDDFLNESGDDDTDRDSDSESTQSNADTDVSEKTSTNGKKRRREDLSSAEPSDAEDSDSSNASKSKLQKRKKRALNRVTSLTNVMAADNKSSGLPSPDTTGPEEIKNSKRGTKEEEEEDDDDDDELEAEMMAGLESSDDEA
ncbi:hypothetical protein EJ05DRAFT_165705 [Pseudovirgaria hyperparasitica]|uniref:RNA polymerase II subunit A C-terminal domain phosphatase n=1 Tax=Pseudovirgaria hyperparasitica TaxID=470096 RepID=A0A6A6VWH9_9PEZI|nr:uncharacterized protein EJ05DRAFT_165705 [Pseudovirgaria hyperparasitica]KAF2753607.1 hypothetical protein EJ05DRAFT_165705 [Pseudovirgaria hyperparasitica]